MSKRVSNTKKRNDRNADHVVATDCAALDRHAAGVDPGIKRRNLVRLRRIEGQIRGMQQMVQDDRYCVDIMVQIAAVRQSLRGVAQELMANHLKHCATKAVAAGPAEATALIDEMVPLMFKGF
jgi:DNA-binding FrmR family transcriptional regulator